MRRYIRFIFYILLLHIIGYLPAKAQLISIDSASANQPLKTALVAYDKLTGKSGSFYNGAAYQFFPLNIKGNAYFPGRLWQKGTLLYNHVNYYNVPLMYDIVRGLVVPKPFDNVFLFSLVPERVDAFSIGNHYFKRIVTDTTNNTLGTGIYEILYNGKTEVLLKRITTVQERTAADEYFEEQVYYYIRNNNTYYKISSKGSILKVLKDKKPALQQHIKQSGLDFRDQKQQAFVELASYYDELTK